MPAHRERQDAVVGGRFVHLDALTDPPIREQRAQGEAGFEVCFVSGYASSATQLGLPDFGYLTQTEIA